MISLLDDPMVYNPCLPPPPAKPRLIGTTNWVIAEWERAGCPELPDDRDYDAPEPGRAEVSLADWVSTQASRYRFQGQETPGDVNIPLLIADELDDLVSSIQFHRASSVTELLATGGRYYRVTLDDLAGLVIDERHFSPLAHELDRETARYLKLGGQAALLVAFTIDLLANQAEDLEAREADDFVLLRHAREQEAFDSYQASIN